MRIYIDWKAQAEAFAYFASSSYINKRKNMQNKYWWFCFIFTNDVISNFALNLWSVLRSFIAI